MRFSNYVEPSQDFHALSRAMDSLKFCQEIAVNHRSGALKPTEHMDATKADVQLIECVNRLLALWYGYELPDAVAYSAHGLVRS